ncbi:MAG TPA: histone deacetylase family protein [Methylocystis sp.]|nr:histone deacetylase family protein [Methylocystis sp.]
MRLTRRAALILGALAPLPLFAETRKNLLLVLPPAGDAPHDPGPGAYDRPERLAAVRRALARPEFATAARVDTPKASLETLLAVHDSAYVERLAAASPRESLTRLSPDVVMSAGTFDAALYAAGGAALATEAVMQGRAKSAFVATRPPGHHALPDEAMGFCFFNNAAVAARHALAMGAERVAIFDFDAHHGNGVQKIFWSERRVLYASTHQTPLFPGTGAVSEQGEHGNIVNAPLAKGDGGEAFASAWRERIFPALDAFSPDLLILCAGFDGHKHDPLAGLRLEAEDFRALTLRLRDFAEKRSEDRVVSLLEGGYRPEDLEASVAAHVGALMGT